MEKSIGVRFELKDLDNSKRTAVIKHAVYNSIDKAGDISHKGMFTKSWQERTPKFCLDHDLKQRAGYTTGTSEDNEGAYTHVKFGTWTLGNDALEMAAEGVFDGASFMYSAEKKDYSQVKDRRIRNLREVKHIETSLLRVEPCHDGAGIVSLVKSIEDANDIQEILNWKDEHLESLKSYIQKIENYCRKAKASDETIISLQNGLIEYKQIISDYDTLITQLIPEPVSSNEEVKELNNFLTSLKLETWKKQNLQLSNLQK